MLGQVIEAQEAERARAARDLHDEIGQSLTSVLLGLRLVEDSLARPDLDLEDCRQRTAEVRSEEHTSELQSLMRISYAVFCLKKENKHQTHNYRQNTQNNTPIPNTKYTPYHH